MRYMIEIWPLTQELRLLSGILPNLFTPRLHRDHISHTDLRIQLLALTHPPRMALREKLTLYLWLSPFVARVLAMVHLTGTKPRNICAAKKHG